MQNKVFIAYAIPNHLPSQMLIFEVENFQLDPVLLQKKTQKHAKNTGYFSILRSNA